MDESHWSLRWVGRGLFCPRRGVRARRGKGGCGSDDGEGRGTLVWLEAWKSREARIAVKWASSGRPMRPAPGHGIRTRGPMGAKGPMVRLESGRGAFDSGRALPDLAPLRPDVGRAARARAICSAKGAELSKRPGIAFGRKIRSQAPDYPGTTAARSLATPMQPPSSACSASFLWWPCSAHVRLARPQWRAGWQSDSRR
jgi:hypothetical protein